MLIVRVFEISVYSPLSFHKLNEVHSFRIYCVAIYDPVITRIECVGSLIDRYSI